jgi:hypothetical protein
VRYSAIALRRLRVVQSARTSLCSRGNRSPASVSIRIGSTRRPGNVAYTASNFPIVLFDQCGAGCIVHPMSGNSHTSIRSRQAAAELRTLREQTGLSGAEVAKLTGMSPSKISRIETGITGLQIEDVAALRKGALGH